MVQVDISKHIPDIQYAYNNLWSSFYDININLAMILPKNGFWPYYEFDNVNNCLILATLKNEPLQIIGFPRRSPRGVPFGKIDIHIEMKQKVCGYSDSNNSVFFRLIESSIKVSYLEHRGPLEYTDNPIDCNILQVMHYDYEPNKFDHPIFHAQFSSKPIDGTLINRTYSNNDSFRRFPEVRIATPPMDLKAILFGIVADHTSHNLSVLNNHQLWKKCEAYLPTLPCETIRSKFDGRMKNEHWYSC